MEKKHFQRGQFAVVLKDEGHHTVHIADVIENGQKMTVRALDTEGRLGKAFDVKSSSVTDLPNPPGLDMLRRLTACVTLLQAQNKRPEDAVRRRAHDRLEPA